MFRNGNPWPEVDHDFVRRELIPGKWPKPEIAIWVPVDPKDPILVGRTSQTEYEAPPPGLGYRRVILRGAPQRTHSRGQETNHAYDSIDEALEMAKTGQFSEIYFNTSLSTATGRVIQSMIRPDVFGRLRDDVENDYIYHSWESLSFGQTLRWRQSQMPSAQGLAPIRGRPVSKRRLRLSPYFREVFVFGPKSRALPQSLRLRVRRRAMTIARLRPSQNLSYHAKGHPLDQNK